MCVRVCVRVCVCVLSVCWGAGDREKRLHERCRPQVTKDTKQKRGSVKNGGGSHVVGLSREADVVDRTLLQDLPRVRVVEHSREACAGVKPDLVDRNDLGVRLGGVACDGDRCGNMDNDWGSMRVSSLPWLERCCAWREIKTVNSTEVPSYVRTIHGKNINGRSLALSIAW